MSNEHPIAFPDHLLQKWIDIITYPHSDGVGPSIEDRQLAELAYRAGADAELEACCQWQDTFNYQNASNLLRAARRPKPPSLAEEALQALNEAVEMSDDSPPEGICANQANIIRTALERLQELENNG